MRPIELGGPYPGRELKRNYMWLLRRRSGKREYTREALAQSASVEPSTVTRGIDAFRRRLPPKWDIVFPGRWGGRQTSGADRQNDKERWANTIRQKLVPLPGELRWFCDHGERDALVERLGRYEMRAEEICELTGVDRSRVRAILARLALAPRASSETESSAR